MRILVPADTRDTRDAHWCPLPLDQSPELADGATSPRGLGLVLTCPHLCFWRNGRKVEKFKG